MYIPAANCVNNVHRIYLRYAGVMCAKVYAGKFNFEVACQKLLSSSPSDGLRCATELRERIVRIAVLFIVASHP